MKRVFLTRGSSDGEGLSQLYLELADAYKKRFMPQKWSNRRIKKLSNMRKNETVLKHPGLKLKFITEKTLANGKLWLYQLERKPTFLMEKELK